MNARLHRAIIEASELRALYVLLYLALLRAWRFLPQSIYILIRFIQRTTTIRITYYLYPVHWVSNPPKLVPSVSEGSIWGDAEGRGV